MPKTPRLIALAVLVCPRPIEANAQPHFPQMKSRTVLVGALFAGALLAGCQSSSIMESLEVGMSKDQVEAILGPPDGSRAQANVEYLSYYLGTDSISRAKPYMIRLVNGKVESFGHLGQPVDLYDRPFTGELPAQPDSLQSEGGPAGALQANSAPVGTASSNPKIDLVAELIKLKELRDQGALTEEEFQKAKARLLSQP